MKKLIVLFLIIASLASCAKKEKKADPRKAQRKPEVRAKIPVIVQKMKRKDLPEFIQITGKLEGITDIVLQSEVAGKIVSIDKKLGDWVEKGQSIARIDNADYKHRLTQAKATHLAAEASFQAANNQMVAMEEMKKSNTISASEYQNAVAQFKNASAALEGAKSAFAKAERDFHNTQFTAPVSGRIAGLPIRIGNYVGMGAQVCSIVNSKKLMIRTGVGEKDIYRLQNNQTVEIFQKDRKQKVKGKIVGIGIKPNQTTATYPIEIQLNNDKEMLYPGMTVSIKIHTKTYKDVFYTSINNLIQDYDEYYAYIITEKDTAKRVPVKLYGISDQYAIFSGGIKENDTLVIEGIESLDNGTKVVVRQEK